MRLSGGRTLLIPEMSFTLQNESTICQGNINFLEESLFLSLINFFNSTSWQGMGHPPDNHTQVTLNTSSMQSGTLFARLTNQ